jgi:hypothetical protein
MDFSKEPWRRLYVNESIDHRAMPLLCRSLRDYLLRVARQQDGVLVRRESSPERAIETLLRGCAAHPDEFELCTRYVQAWIDDGYLVIRRRNARCDIVISRYVEAQNVTSSSAARQRRYRDRKRKQKEAKSKESLQLSLVTDNVTRDATDDVTVDTTETQRVTSKRKKEKKERKKETKTRASVCDRALFWRDDKDGPHTHDPPHTWSEVKQVLRCGDEVWNTNSRVANSADPRVQTIVDRFCDGFDVNDLCEALRGSKRDAFIASRPTLQCVKTLLKDAQAVDKYAKQLHAPSSGPAPRVQPPAGDYYEHTGFEEAEARGGPVPQLEPDDPFVPKAVADDANN